MGNCLFCNSGARHIRNRGEGVFPQEYLFVVSSSMNGIRLIKIGRARNVAKKIKQWSSPVIITIYQMADTKFEEKELLKLLRQRHSKREINGWFNLSTAEVLMILDIHEFTMDLRNKKYRKLNGVNDAGTIK